MKNTINMHTGYIRAQKKTPLPSWEPLLLSLYLAHTTLNTIIPDFGEAIASQKCWYHTRFLINFSGPRFYVNILFYNSMRLFVTDISDWSTIYTNIPK